MNLGQRAERLFRSGGMVAECGLPRQRSLLQSAMANLVAFLFGLIALILAIIGFIPLLGWLNWFIIVIAGLGAAIGFVSDRNSGRNFCFVVIAICAFRLFIGGGII
jgi:hypothetical protein